MLLFYLQQLSIPLLPPVEEFQKRVHPYFVNRYNFAFDDRLPNLTKNQNRCSELLLGFFKFYKNFDFESLVICPLYGKAFRKADILAKKLPEFQQYYEMLNSNPNLSPMQLHKCICIQDPFETTHSIPGVIAKLEFHKILWKFEYTAEIIDSELQSQGESTKLLLSIFDAEKLNHISQQKIQKHPKILRSRQESSVTKSLEAAIYRISLHIKPTDFHQSIVRKILTKKNRSTHIHRAWAEYTIEGIALILKDIFLVKMNVSENESNGTEKPLIDTITTPNSQDRNVQKDFESELCANFSREFIITGSRDVFLGRKQTKNITVNSFNSEMLESQDRFDKTSLEIHLNAAVKISTNLDSYDEITIEFNDLIKTKKNNSFKPFITIFEQNLHNLLKIYLVHCLNVP